MHALTPLTRVVAGRARTRGPTAVKPPPNLRRIFIDSIRAEEVLGFDAAALPENPIFGDMTARRAVTNGAAGLVTDGLV